MKTKAILDPCCGSKMFYMDRNDSRVDFCDVRELNTNLCDGRKLVVDPDYIADVTNLPQKDETYYLVVFDPPHLNTIGETSWMCKKIWAFTARLERVYEKSVFRVLESA